jgi:hypothetical protein
MSRRYQISKALPRRFDPAQQPRPANREKVKGQFGMAPQDCLVFSENSPQLTLASENSVDF